MDQRQPLRRIGGMRDPEARRKAERYGRLAETQAVLLLMLKGFRILARRCRTPAGELDIVARRGRLLVACEVKARRIYDAEAVAPRQWARIAEALEAYVARHPRLDACDRRYDLVDVVRGRLPRHRPDAWRP